MADPHEGEVPLTHTFVEAHKWLAENGPVDLVTVRRGTPFQAMAATVQKGPRQGEQVILFMRDGEDRARAYMCCWGHYYNCGQTRIGMYCEALDVVLFQGIHRESFLR